MTGLRPEERPPAPVMEFRPMNMQVLDARRDHSGGYKVDVSRGEADRPRIVGMVLAPR